MRTIETHRVNECNEALDILVHDDPGAGGASHLYTITGFDSKNNPSDRQKQWGVPADRYAMLLFQNGPINEVGVNGITQEALLAIIIDRLQCFQNGPYVCRENAMALAKLEEAQHWLHHRTRQRVVRGVEGTHAV